MKVNKLELFLLSSLLSVALILLFIIVFVATNL